MMAVGLEAVVAAETRLNGSLSVLRPTRHRIMNFVSRKSILQLSDRGGHDALGISSATIGRRHSDTHLKTWETLHGLGRYNARKRFHRLTMKSHVCDPCNTRSRIVGVHEEIRVE